MKTKNNALKSVIDQATGLPTTDRWVIRNDKVILVDKEHKPKQRI